jgi:uncharacterized protein (UPF0264 family)
MTVTAVTPPTPPNANLDRSMFVWCGTAGSAGDPLGTDAKMQSLLNFCATNGVNLLYLDIWGYLGGGNFTTAHMQSVQKFIHYAHASGIQVWALAGNTDWPHNQQWVMANITRRLMEYQMLADSSSTTNIDAHFDGVMLDVEYWTVSGYTSVDVVGLIDLVKAMKHVLNLPVGCALSQWQADPASAALTVAYAGDTELEGILIARNVDAVAVMSYSNNGAGIDGAVQIAMFQNWFNDAATPGVNRDYGLWCCSLTMTGQPAGQSYAGETKAKMEQNHTAISAAFTAAPNTNAAFRGQGIQDYASYSGMS